MDEPRFTRRGLFRGLGTASVIGACARSGQDGKAPGSGLDGAAEQEIGPGPAGLQFRLDGKDTSIQAEPRTTLLTLLRDDLGITGPKLVCDRGSCGACTVHVDGLPRNACMMLAHDVHGKTVGTVAGLASETLSPLQRAFVEHDALQCGFCTSGMLMSCAALLQRHKPGTRLDADAVKQAISGNLCRCGTYPNVIAAVLSVADKAGGA